LILFLFVHHLHIIHAISTLFLLPFLASGVLLPLHLDRYVAIDVPPLSSDHSISFFTSLHLKKRCAPSSSSL
jgi:hypothetical protein